MCPRKEDGSMYPQSHYKGMYNCGGNDVYCDGTYDCDGFDVPAANRTQVFWAMAYITPWGAESNRRPACVRGTAC